MTRRLATTPRTRLDLACTAEEYATIRDCAVATGRQIQRLVLDSALAECRRIRRKIAASSKSTEGEK
jgi:uncharacterized protein (DUF1778 family)